MNQTCHASKRLRLRHNFSWTFIGNVINAGSWFAITIVLAQLGSPEHVGQFALGLAVSAPVFMFAAMRLRDIQATETTGEYCFGDYLALRLITTAFALTVVIGMVFAIGYQKETALVIIATAFSKTVEAISDTFYGLFMQHERLDRIAKSMMMKGPLSLTLLTVGFVTTQSVFWGVVGLVLARVTILVTYDLYNLRSSLSATSKFRNRFGGTLPRPRFNAVILKRLTWLALPLGFVKMLISFNINIPRLFIASQLGSYQLGIFAAVAAFQKTAPTVVQALGQSASPRLAKYYASNNVALFRSLSWKLMGIGFCLGSMGVLVAAVAGRKILTLFYGPEYAQPELFVLLMGAAGIDYIATMLLYSATAARYFRIQLPLHLLTAVSIAVACFWLVPIFGLNGAGIALIVGNLVRVAGSLIVVIYAQRELEKKSVEPSCKKVGLVVDDVGNRERSLANDSSSIPKAASLT